MPGCPGPEGCTSTVVRPAWVTFVKRTRKSRTGTTVTFDPTGVFTPPGDPSSGSDGRPNRFVGWLPPLPAVTVRSTDPVSNHSRSRLFDRYVNPPWYVPGARLPGAIVSVRSPGVC